MMENQEKSPKKCVSLAATCSAHAAKSALELYEPHPSAQPALSFILSLGLDTLLQIREATSSCGYTGNRTAEICGETLRRILDKEKVSDRYILGLAWFIMDIGKDANIKIIKDLVNSPKGVVPDDVYKAYPGITF
jgi:hypothetical protein